MPMDRFLIAPYDQNSGQQNNVRPWLIPDEAFQELTNAYVFRGRVRKRFGSRWFGETSLESRFRVRVDTTDPAFDAFGAVPGASGAVGQMFSIGTQLFTVTQSGTAPLNDTGSSGIASFNTVNGVYAFVAVDFASTAVYWYPALPVMGLLTYENAPTNDETIIGFDTRFAYEYTGGWERLDQELTPGAATWTGNNSQFFWATTWGGAEPFNKVLYVTNFNQNEPNFMRTFFNNQWDNFRPQISATPTYLNSCRLLVVFKNRLVALNTWEGAGSPGDNYTNRARYCQIGSPLDADAWRQDIKGKGNAIDCPTSEAIITAEFVRDRLIVFFERSTWELVYTGNQAYPFVWQQINTELGAESTFSIVPFDKVAIGVANVGIMACNSTNVDRIDDKIPNTVFDIHNVDGGVERVYGIRDYFVEMIYWAFPDTDSDSNFPYPTRVLVYNYKTGTWAFFEDSITVFGYFQPTEGITWNSNTVTWDDDVSWDSGALQGKFRQVVAGNQEGYTFICDSDATTNAAVLQITNVTSTPVTRLQIIDHNLREEQYIYIQGAIWDDASNSLNGQIYQVIFIFDKDNVDIGPIAPFTGVYLGGGLVSRVSNIVLRTKEYNFYAKEGRNAMISKIDFMVDATAAGQMQVDFFASTTTVPLLEDSAGNGCLLGTGTLDTFPYTAANGTASPIPFEATAARLWHPVYFQADGEVVQFQMTMNDAQMRNTDVRDSGFQLHAICIYAQPSSSRFE
jgi:hypothetical protein